MCNCDYQHFFFIIAYTSLLIIFAIIIDQIDGHHGHCISSDNPMRWHPGLQTFCGV